MPGQGRLGDKAKATADAHGCPGCPHMVLGPGISGSPNVLVNTRPALRVSDRGVHAPCCAGNSWVADAGSQTVLINGKPAHRIGDRTVHCGDAGELMEGSGNVIIGGATSGGAGAPSIASLTLPPVAAPGVPIALSVGSFRLPPFVSRVIAAVTWTVDGKEQPQRGQEVSVTLGSEHAGKNVVVRARLGAGRPYQTAVKVPKLTVEGPDTVEIDDEIQLRAKMTPSIDGSYVWFDAEGKQVGEGRKLPFVGKRKSREKGDQPAECRFTAREGGRVYSAKHPITVEKVPRLRLPINISLDDLDQTIRWLRENPMEVRIDDAVAGCHAMVQKAGRIVVSFSATPGEHSVVVSSGAANWAAGKPTIRIVHFSSRVKVTATD